MVHETASCQHRAQAWESYQQIEQQYSRYLEICETKLVVVHPPAHISLAKKRRRQPHPRRKGFSTTLNCSPIILKKTFPMDKKTHLYVDISSVSRGTPGCHVSLAASKTSGTQATCVSCINRCGLGSAPLAFPHRIKRNLFQSHASKPGKKNKLFLHTHSPLLVQNLQPYRSHREHTHT